MLAPARQCFDQSQTAEISLVPASEVSVVVFARFDPAPFAVSLLSFPEPRGGFQVIHAEIHRIKSGASMLGSGRDTNDGFSRPHDANAVYHQETHQIETLKGSVCKLVHAGLC